MSDDLRQSHGNHTWDLIVDYFCCAKCEYIFENREQYEDHFGKLQKEVECPRCHFLFNALKNSKIHIKT